jgi:phosphoglucosamine mutase
MTNMAVELALKKHGLDMVRARVGDRYVLEALQEKGWILGGEGSGHLLVLDKHTTGDGLVSALQVLQACVRAEKSMKQLLSSLHLFPQTLINVRLAPHTDWQSNCDMQASIKSVESELAGNGRVLIRASGTEPLVRVMVEAPDAALAQSCAERIANTLG